MATGSFVVDKNDISIVRDDEYYKRIFVESDLELISDRKFDTLPGHLYLVKTYILK